MSHLLWKRCLGRLMSVVPAPATRRVILLYHALGDTPPAVAASRFRVQLQWLHDHARLCSFAQLLEGGANAPLEVALSFDDGYASLHDEVAPLLQQYGTNAIVYLNSSLIGDDTRQSSDVRLGHYPRQQFLLWREAEALASAGWSVGSHGAEHLDLTATTAADTMQQLLQSKQRIEQHLQQPCEHFAYTWGRFNKTLQQQVRSAGYATAASALHGPLRSGSDRYALPRIDVRADYELGDFIDAVSGRWDFLGRKQQLWRLWQ